MSSLSKHSFLMAMIFYFEIVAYICIGDVMFIKLELDNERQKFHGLVIHQMWLNLNIFKVKYI